MRAGNTDQAYRIASTHYLTEGSSFADLEWLSGYLALTYLNDPELALSHFQRFDAAVFTPISKGRAGYWLGRAHEALGNSDQAQNAYAQGAVHQTSFYGLLAAQRGGMSFDTALSEEAAVERYGAAVIGRARFGEIARGLVSGVEDGMLKIVACPEGRRLLGIHIIGDSATELIHVGQMALVAESDVDVFIENIFNFPTLAEAYRVAALDILNRRPQ